jgi:methylated-DNA-[protein]-cysteine S-methyltransferase
MHIDYLTTPLGMVEIQASEQGITQVIFCGNQRKTIATNELINRCKQQLNQYFNGQRKHFDLPLDLRGTLFQKSIWTCLTEIPFGHTCSYRDIADMIDNRKAVRAVGGANGRNPISIIVPCHRVIGTNGALTGYAGGIERKLWLLKHEGISVKGPKRNDTLELNHVIECRQNKTHFLN